MLDLFWELQQQSGIRHTERRADAAARSADEAGAAASRIDERIDRLLLINRALWELLAERSGLREADLAAKVEEIDLRDGQLDGKLRAAPRQCPACARRLAARHARCLYCGAEQPGGEPFDRV